MSAFATGARLAVGTLSIVPVGTLPTIDRAAARWAMVLAPVAALPVAVLAGAVAWAGPQLGLPGLVTGALICAALAWGTRAMHWDGLADTADGLAAGWNRERALEVMRKGDAGPVAVGVLSLILIIDSVVLGSFGGGPWTWLIVGLLVVVSRAACTLAATRGIAAARPDGLGVVVAGSVPPVLTVVVAAACIALLAGIGSHVYGNGLAMAIAGVAGLGAAGLLVLRCRRVLGGVTGDVMGAAVEVAFTVMLVVLVAGLTR